MSRLKAEALWNIPYIDVTPEVSHALMSSLKDAAAVLQSLHEQSEQHETAQNKYDMSVTPDVSQVEIWP